MRCLVTGGSRNLGRALCVAFARAGARVAFTFHERADEAAETGRLLVEVSGERPLVFQGSVADAGHASEVVAELVRAWGGVDVLVNNAALFQPMPFALIEEADWDRIMDVGAKGPYLFARAALRPMLRQRRGHILNIGAFSEGRSSARLPPHFAAAKAALHGFTRALALEVGERGIQVNYLAPGLLAAGMAQRIPEGRLREFAAHAAQPRLATAEDIAAIATFLVSPDNSFMSGANILSDGGVRG